MARFELKESPVPRDGGVVHVVLEGGLDLASVPLLEQCLEQLQRQGRLKVVVDLRDLEFISSSGLGAFLGAVNRFREGAGDLALVRPSPKVLRVFQMLGFHKVLTLLPSLEDGFEHFAPKPVRPAAFQVRAVASAHSGQPFRLEAWAIDVQGQVVAGYGGVAELASRPGIVSPLRIGPFVQGACGMDVVLTGPGLVSLRLQDGDIVGHAEVEVQAHREPASFPLRAGCPGCGGAVEAQASDVYRCLDCGTVLLVDRWGQVIVLRRSESTEKEALVHQLGLPADVNALGPVRSYVAALLRQQAYPEGFVDDVELALDEALSNVVEHACAYDVRLSISLRMELRPEGVLLVLKDNGRAFDPRSAVPLDLERHLEARHRGGLGRYLMEKLMDQVDYSAEGGGNLLRMAKRVRSARPAPDLQPA